MGILSRIGTSLRVRLTVSMILMLLPLVILAAAGFFSLQAVVGVLEETVEEVTDEMHPLMELQLMIQDSLMPLHDYLIHGSPSEKKLFQRKVRDVDTLFKDTLSSDFELEEERVLIEAAHKEWVLFLDQARSIFTSSPEPEYSAEAKKMEDLDIQAEKIRHLLQQNHSLTMRELNEHKAHSVRIQQIVFLLNTGIFVIGLGTAIFAIAVLSRSVLSPVTLLKQAADNFGDGDLAARVDLKSADELGSLANSFNAMADKLAYSQEALQQMATHDALTELYNHREFYLRVKEELERSQRYGHVFSVLLLDLDNFKEINDTFGHQSGDKALQSIASLLLREARPVDIVARYGGDEFGIILPETPFMNALNMAERILSAVEAHSIIVHPGEEHQITASIGVASFPEDGTAENEIISGADQALYAAKNGGRNRVSSVHST